MLNNNVGYRFGIAQASLVPPDALPGANSLKSQLPARSRVEALLLPYPRRLRKVRLHLLGEVHPYLSDGIQTNLCTETGWCTLPKAKAWILRTLSGSSGSA